MFNFNKMLWLIFAPSLLIGALGFLYQIPPVKVSIILISFILIIFFLKKTSQYESRHLRNHPDKAEELKRKYEKQDRFWAKHYIMYDFFELLMYVVFSIIGSIVVWACRMWILSN